VKTAEEIKAQIKHLENELLYAELADGYVARIKKCVRTGADHKWTVQSCETTIDHEPVYMWGRMNPVSYEAQQQHEKALLYCDCGVRLTFEEG
jgi:hypothetical protein